MVERDEKILSVSIDAKNIDVTMENDIMKMSPTEEIKRKESN